MKSLRAQGILPMGKIVQVALLPVGEAVSGYKLICAVVPPAPAAHQGPSWANCPPVCGKKLLSPTSVPRTGPGSILGRRTHLRNVPYPRQEREFW